MVADCDVLVLPSLQEPFGRSVIEAMALGTPVVASRVGGIPEIIDDGVHGLLTRPGDPEALARALAALQDPKNKRMIKADDSLKTVFGGKATVNMFEMTKLVSKHLK